MDDISRLKDTLRSFWSSSLPELNRLAAGNEDNHIIEAVLEELVEVAVTGQDECAVQAQEVLAVKYRDVSEKNRSDIIEWIFDHTEKYDEDSWKYFLGFNFVIKLNWEELYVQYIKRYDAFLRIEFGEDYIEYYGLEQYAHENH